MDNIFKPLDCDDDVVLLDQDTFKVGRLKNLALADLRRKILQQIFDDKTQRPAAQINSFFRVLFGNQSIKFNELKCTYFIDCQLLKIGSKGWQKGKLRIQTCVSNQDVKLDKVYLDFSSDEPAADQSCWIDCSLTTRL